MEYIYVLFLAEYTSNWENVKIYTNEKSAIHASVQYPNCHVEIFEKSTDGSFEPSLNYYHCGILITPYN